MLILATFNQKLLFSISVYASANVKTSFIIIIIIIQKPTFAKTGSEEISDFLHPVKDIPHLDMFSCDGTTDVNAALVS